MPWSKLAAACALLAVACSGGADPGPMREAIEPRLAAFGEYDRWARRLGLADSAFGSEEALSEAAFAPLRDQSDVLAAWLVREGPDAHTLAHPPGAPSLPADGWVRVTTESMGELEGRHAMLPFGDHTRQCLLIRRSAPAPGDATLHVVMAFDDAP